MEQRPKVGVGVIVIKSGKVLLLRRRGSHDKGTWYFPSDHLEFNEKVEDCARREVREEAGIKIKNIRFAAVTNDLFREEGKHYITLFMVSEYESGEEKILEPEKCDRLGWFEWKDLPRPLFLPITNLLKQGFNLFQH